MPHMSLEIPQPAQLAEEKEAEAKSPDFIGKALFDKRHVIITGGIDDKIARATTEKLLALAAISDDPITLFISSPGGHVESGDMIHDMIKFVAPTVKVVGTGWVASAGALIFAAADKGNRFCLPNTRFLLHQPSGGMGGTAEDLAIQAKQIIAMRERLNKIFADATGRDLEQVRKDTDRDYWMTPDEAIDYGLLDKVVTSSTEV